MKKMLPFLFIMAAGYTQAQVVVGDVNINDIPEVRICRMEVYSKLLSTKVMIYIDYGQDIRRGDKDMMVLDKATAKEREFNSEIAAVNFMEANGWEYVDSIVYTENSQIRYRYHFRRKPVS